MNSDKVVEFNRVSFILSSVESFGESIEVSEAYVLPDLNQSQRTFPERIDVRNHSFLCKIEFPEVDIKRVHSCGKQHPLCTHTERSSSP